MQPQGHAGMATGRMCAWEQGFTIKGVRSRLMRLRDQRRVSASVAWLIKGVRCGAYR